MNSFTSRGPKRRSLGASYPEFEGSPRMKRRVGAQELGRQGKGGDEGDFIEVAIGRCTPSAFVPVTDTPITTCPIGST